MQITLKDYSYNNQGPHVEVKLTSLPNSLAIRLSHSEEEHYVTELYLDYFENKIQLAIYDIDQETSGKECVSALYDEPAKLVPICDDWRNHKPKDKE
jgi:hypothetical protein